MHWILVTTSGGREKWALENIRRQGHDGYLPMCEELVKGAKRLVPLFPRYLFVQVVSQWWYLKGTFGVTGIVLGKDGPAIVPEKIVRTIREKERDGVISLPAAPLPEFEMGQEVILDGRGYDGPFDGFVGVYDGMTGAHRAKVLLDIMGRVVPVEAELASLRAV